MKSIVLDDQRILTSLTAFYINISMLLDCLGNIFILIGKPFIFRNVLQKGTYLLFIFILVFFLIKFSKNWLDLFIKGSFFLILFLGSVIINPQIRVILFRSFFVFFADVFCVYCLISHVKDLKKFEKAMYLYICIGIIYAIILLLIYKKLPHGYSMDFSYKSFPLAGFALLIGIQKKKKSFIFIYFAILFTNLIAGSRGVLICNVLLLGQLYLFTIKKNNYKTRIYGIFLFLICVTIFALNIPGIGDVLSSFFPNSRTIELLSKGNLNLLTGREIYYSICIKEIIKNPLKVRGVLSDRVYIGQQLNKADGDFFGAYAHNFFLELGFQYGIWGLIFSVMVIVVLIITFVKVFKMKNLEPELVHIFIVASSYSIGQLVFSNSYITSIAFGMAYGAIRLVNYKWNSRFQMRGDSYRNEYKMRRNKI